MCRCAEREDQRQTALFARRAPSIGRRTSRHIVPAYKIVQVLRMPEGADRRRAVRLARITDDRAVDLQLKRIVTAQLCLRMQETQPVDGLPKVSSVSLRPTLVDWWAAYAELL